MFGEMDMRVGTFLRLMAIGRVVLIYLRQSMIKLMSLHVYSNVEAKGFAMLIKHNADEKD